MAENVELKEFDSVEKLKDIDSALEECFEVFDQSKKIVITTHMNPDGDAIGCALGLWHYANARGKDAVVINNNETPHNFKFLPGTDTIKVYNKERDYDDFMNADLIVVVDVNDSKRLRSVQEPIIDSPAKKIVIDHHIDPRQFADAYAIDTDCGSAGELIYRFIKLDKEYKISKAVAENLYVAIMTDTGSFRFPRTDAEVHRIIAELIEAGADPVRMYDEVYNTMSLRAFQLFGRAFASMEMFFGGKMGVMRLRQEDFIETGSNPDDVENIVENSLSIRGAMVGILVSDFPGNNELRISFRSKGDYSVRELASQFNGGGHKNAAGARMYDLPIDEAVGNILVAAEKLFGFNLQV